MDKLVQTRGISKNWFNVLGFPKKANDDTLAEL